jgi:hypothetical protein
MGTNYYFHPSSERECPHCKQDTPGLHIGKSSAGWNFSLRIHPDDGIASLADWQARWDAGGAIFNEYGERIEVAAMLATITERSWHGGLLAHTDPGAMGPYAGHLDVRRGGDTYDLCNYEFS